LRALSICEDAEYNWGDGSISPSEWQLRVSQAIKEIEGTKLEKVVLARDLKVNSHRAIDPRKILRNLSAEYPSTWIFAVDGLIGATPELLTSPIPRHGYIARACWNDQQNWR